jgi:hypothetical protein
LQEMSIAITKGTPAFGTAAVTEPGPDCGRDVKTARSASQHSSCRTYTGR